MNKHKQNELTILSGGSGKSYITLLPEKEFNLVIKDKNTQRKKTFY